MITGFSEKTNFAVRFSDGKHDGQSDTIPEKGGGASGFRPHGLLEAAYASCINMTIRMFANKHNIPLSDVTTQVTLCRDESDTITFEYKIDLEGTLNDMQRETLYNIARTCPVRKTLSKKIEFSHKK